jgi:hypothetical protein
MSMKDNERANVTFTLSSRLMTKLREECKHFGQEENKVVEDALRHWIDEHMAPAKADDLFEYLPWIAD